MAQLVPIVGVRHPRRGFTLIEMLVVLIIVGILSVMAYSGWTKVMWLVQAKGSADQFRNAVLLARSDAMARRHNSGLYLDPANRRYLRFVDSAVVGGVEEHNGTYDEGKEKVLQAWDTLPRNLVFQDVSSMSTTDPVPRVSCQGAAAQTTTTFTDYYPVVFRPDGRANGPFHAQIGVTGFPNDTFTIDVVPAAGLVTMRH
jgi:prepilin-type N-terminal cleavage/methylation domain-containing protein